MFTQISVLLLYKRIFTLHRIWFRNTLAVIAFFALTSNLSAVLAVIFQCSPVRKAWNGSFIPGRCIDETRLFVAHAGLSLLVDLAVVVAPIRVIWSLHPSRRTKVAVSGMVLLGSLSALHFSSIRLDRLLTDSQSFRHQPSPDLLFCSSPSWGHDMLIFPNPFEWSFLIAV